MDVARSSGRSNNMAGILKKGGTIQSGATASCSD